MRKVALVTDRQHGLTPDDGLLVSVLQENGFDVSVEQWDSESTDWERYDLCVLRSCWDYHVRIGEFLQWLTRLEERGVKTMNPIQTVRWNHDKRYLKEMERRGVPIVPTRVVDKPDGACLGEVIDSCGWETVVFKPCISASGYRTHKVLRSEADVCQSEFNALVQQSGALIQPFLKEVQAVGEWSFVFFGRKFSHAVIKKPGDGEFRTQEVFGGTALKAVPTDTQVRQAERVVGSVDGDLLYARVDMVEVNGKLLLGELELIEPFLFFSSDPDSPMRFARALKELLW